MTKQELKTLIETKINGYGNGHAHYCIIDLAEQRFIDWLYKYPILYNGIEKYYADQIGNLKQETINGFSVLSFDTFEKYGPCLTENFTSAFPSALIYAFDCWNAPTVYVMKNNMDVIPSDTYNISIAECFISDEYSIRLDLKLEDKLTGLTFEAGDLISDFNTEEQFKHNSSFAELADLWEYSNKGKDTPSLINMPEVKDCLNKFLKELENEKDM